jgi:hypothetical protein
MDQILDRSRDVLDRYVWVDAVLVEQVDAIGAESFQRRIGDRPDVLRSAVHTNVRERAAECVAKLGCDYDLIAEGGEGFAHDFLVPIGAVCLGGVEEGDAALDRQPDQSDRVTSISLWAVAGAQAHAAEAEGRNL